MTRASIWSVATGLAAGLILHSVAWPAKKTAKQFFNPDGRKPSGYTHVVKSPPGTMVFISGQGGVDADGKMPADFGSQARNTFENLKKCLAMAGGTFTDIVKINYYVTDMANTQELRRVRAGYIDMENPPASTLVQTGLGQGLLLEVEVVAILPEN